MSESLACTCKIVSAMDRINDVRSYIDDFVQEPPETLPIVDKRIVEDRTKNALRALDEAAQTCNLNLEDVKAKVNLTNMTFRNQKWFVAFDHIIDAKAKLANKVCGAGL